MGLLDKAATIRKKKEKSLFYKALECKNQKQGISDENENRTAKSKKKRENI